MSRSDEIWINATAVSHNQKNYADIRSGGFGETTKSEVTSKAVFSGDEISFNRAAVGAKAAHNRGPLENPHLKVEVKVNSFRFQGLGRTLTPMLAVKKVLAKLESQDTLNFDKSGFKELRIFNHLVDISYKNSGEVRGGFLNLFKKPRFPFPFPSNSNGNQEETIVRSLSWSDARAEEALKAEGIEVKFEENRIEINRSGEQIAEIKLGVIQDLRSRQEAGQPVGSNGRDLGRLTMCEIRTPITLNGGEAAALNGGDTAARPAPGEEIALLEADAEGPCTTTVGDVRSDSVGT